MERISDRIATTEGLLRAREEELDRQLLARPQAIAQKVEVELIKNARRNAPWLLPMIVKF